MPDFMLREKILTKQTANFAGKWFVLQDEEEKQRKRKLDGE